MNKRPTLCYQGSRYSSVSFLLMSAAICGGLLTSSALALTPTASPSPTPTPTEPATPTPVPWITSEFTTTIPVVKYISTAQLIGVSQNYIAVMKREKVTDNAGANNGFKLTVVTIQRNGPNWGLMNNQIELPSALYDTYNFSFYLSGSLLFMGFIYNTETSGRKEQAIRILRKDLAGVLADAQISAMLPSLNRDWSLSPDALTMGSNGILRLLLVSGYQCIYRHEFIIAESNPSLQRISFSPVTKTVPGTNQYCASLAIHADTLAISTREQAPGATDNQFTIRVFSLPTWPISQPSIYVGIKFDDTGVTPSLTIPDGRITLVGPETVAVLSRSGGLTWLEAPEKIARNGYGDECATNGRYFAVSAPLDQWSNDDPPNSSGSVWVFAEPAGGVKALPIARIALPDHWFFGQQMMFAGSSLVVSSNAQGGFRLDVFHVGQSPPEPAAPSVLGGFSSERSTTGFERPRLTVYS